MVMRSYSNEAINFHNEEVPGEVGSNYNCLAVISLDSVLKKGENYYSQAFLKECKYICKKVIRHITSDSDESDEE